MIADLFRQFVQGKASYDDIKEALSSSLTSSPELHGNVLELLNDEDAKDILTVTQYQELIGLVNEITQTTSTAPEATVYNDHTRIIGVDGGTLSPTTQTGLPSDITGQIYDDSTELAVTQLASATPVRPAQSPQQNPDLLKPGDTIKGRFVLEQLIGQGGMGVVFKARDLRKEEAMDRNPYVAIKVLGEAFKDHPQALIALQRESRKAQTLAHPNIVTVFDFDRDGDIVYMTMEYLEGEPLDQMIKKNYPNPFDKEQALHIIDGICSGLAYAHSHNIIHSDLKPGNVYVTKNNTIKVFDFGIARAMKKHEGGKVVDELSGETTLFDAADLGGLTPAYASYEMLTGEEPDIRDDIYALACISYELLFGKHPFNKQPANKAKERNLAPPPVADLNRRQSRALEQAISHDREKRTPSVDQFQDELCGKHKLSKTLIAVSVAASIATVGAISVPIMNYLDNQEIAGLVGHLNSGDEDQILNTLAVLPSYEPKIKDGALQGGKDALIKYYEDKAEQETDTTKEQYNFAKASQLLEDAKQLYPDSAQLEAVISRIGNRKNALLNDVTNRFNEYIDSENLIAKPKTDDLLDALMEAALIEKDHPLLTDPRIPVAYTQAAQKAAQSNNLRYAEQLVLTGLALMPTDMGLVNMQDAIEAAKTGSGDSAAQLAKLKESLEKSIPPEQRKQSIQELLNTPFSNRQWSQTLAAQFSLLQEAVGKDDPWVKAQTDVIRDIYVAQAEEMRKATRYSQATNVIETAKTIVPATKQLLDEERLLVAAKNKYEQEQKRKAESARIAGAKQTLLTQAKANDVDGAKETLATLGDSLAANDAFLNDEAPKAIGNAYLRLAQLSARRGDYRAATDLVQDGLQVAPEHSSLNQALQSYQAKVPQTSTSTLASAPGDPCSTKFAGHGTRSRATCSDELSEGVKGPTMVVVPAGSNIATPFAIGKYEVSVADYNAYCQASKACSVRGGDTSLPITNIGIKDARAYSQWLTQTSGYSYRLPSDNEWLHAAGAAGKQPEKDFNCQLSLGGNLLKGKALLSSRSGRENGWGLSNYIGNAQELVTVNASTYKVRGGSYKDSLASCDVSLNKNHSGNADALTGFRLVRELKIGS